MCTESSRERELDGEVGGSREYRRRCGTKQGRLVTGNVSAALKMTGQEEEATGRVGQRRGLGVTERERACN